jgi:hypothetical protein
MVQNGHLAVAHEVEPCGGRREHRVTQRQCPASPRAGPAKGQEDLAVTPLRSEHRRRPPSLQSASGLGRWRQMGQSSHFVCNLQHTRQKGAFGRDGLGGTPTQRLHLVCRVRDREEADQR